MIKFSNDRDANWEIVANEIADMVAEGQRKEGTVFPEFDVPSRASSVASSHGHDEEEHSIPVAHEANGKAIVPLAMRGRSLTHHPEPVKISALQRAQSFGKRSTRKYIRELNNPFCESLYR